MFVPHAVDPDQRLGHLGLELVERNVHLEVDVVLHRQVPAQVLQILRKQTFYISNWT